MTADQTLANIDATLDHVSRYDLVAGGVVDGAVSMRWRPRTTAVGPGWVPSLPVTFQEITEAAVVERQVVEPLRIVLDNSTATFTPTGTGHFGSGERSHDLVASHHGPGPTHIRQDYTGTWHDNPCDCKPLSPVKRIFNKVFGRKP